MDNIVLDLGSNVNVLPKRAWEMMEKPKLVWSPVQLRLANQQKIIPFGRLSEVMVDLDAVHFVADFGVIEIVDNSNPFPALLGIVWALDN